MYSAYLQKKYVFCKLCIFFLDGIFHSNFLKTKCTARDTSFPHVFDVFWVWWIPLDGPCNMKISFWKLKILGYYALEAKLVFMCDI